MKCDYCDEWFIGICWKCNRLICEEHGKITGIEYDRGGNKSNAWECVTPCNEEEELDPLLQTVNQIAEIAQRMAQSPVY